MRKPNICEGEALAENRTRTKVKAPNLWSERAVIPNSRLYPDAPTF